MRSSLCLLVPALAVAAVTLGGACSGDKTASAPPAPAGSAASAAPAPAPAAAVEIFINETSVAKIDAAHLAGWPRLDTLVPADVRKLGTWEAVAFQSTSAGVTPAVISHPSASFPDMVPAIFPGEGGGAAFGMFDPVELARKGKPARREDHLTAIRIKVAQGGNRGQNDDGGDAAADPTKLVLTIKTPAGTTTLSGDKLLALPREPMPDNVDQKGWQLTKVLEAAGVKAYEHLVLSDVSGTNLTLERKDFDANTRPFIKLNKKGSLRFRVLKKTGEGWNPSGDLRSLVTIEAR
jgi:hypothetical protein